ncbi:hypothetical protein BKA65DRAFT_62503 [Rhexocercosporidium sp. MPI-PUGE-AT-0058]|nr:hypothetical protein BKA65DRAFT_62503 [Rhexocercosporidium sp. MPI-PUGE-AT-0058]
MKLMIAVLALNFMEHESVEEGGHLHDAIIGLDGFAFDDGTFDLVNFAVQADEMLTAFEVNDILDRHICILNIAVAVASFCSVIKWDESADALFQALIVHHSKYFDRTERSFDKARAYIEYAHHQQRQKKWVESITTLHHTYLVLSKVTVVPGNRAQFGSLVRVSRWLLGRCPMPLGRISNPSVREEIEEIDKQVASMISKDNDIFARSLPGRKEKGNATTCSSSSISGKYGFTYTESLSSGMTGLSLGYSAMFS